MLSFERASGKCWTSSRSEFSIRSTVALPALLTHDGEHRQAAVLELLQLQLGESLRVVGVRVPLLTESAEFSRCLEVSRRVFNGWQKMSAVQFIR